MMWTNILIQRGCELSAKQLACMKAYDADPTIRDYDAAAQILYAHSFEDEAIEIMLAGLNRYPDDQVARICLCEWCYRKTLFSVAHEMIELAHMRGLHDNVLGWQLRFKLAVLCGHAHQATEAMAALDMLPKDPMMSDLIASYTLRGEESTWDMLAQDVQVSPDELISLTQTLRQSRLSEDPPLPLNTGEEIQIPSYDGFYAVPLSEVFGASSSHDSQAHHAHMSPELDSQTLAEIFEKQGYYERSLEIYRRLSEKNPAHEGLRNRIRDLEIKVKHEHTHIHTGPLSYQSGQLVDDFMNDMDKKRYLDRKTQFLQGLLEQVRIEDLTHSSSL